MPLNAGRTRMLRRHVCTRGLLVVASKRARAAATKLSPVPLQVVSKATKLDDDEGGAGAAAPEYVAEKGGATVWLASTVIFICGLIGMAFAGFLFWTVSQISLDSSATVCGHDVAMIALGSRGGRSRWCAMKGRQGR